MDEALWGETGVSLDERTRLEKRLRDAGEDWVRPQGTFGFLARTDLLDPVAFDIPDPDAALATWEDRSVDEVYGPPSPIPSVERSETMHGPGTREYLVRFPTPSPFVDDTAYARVYEPFEADPDAALSTLVFGTGLAMACDLIGYWTEEEYVGRDLAQRGYRVVLPIPPWHGRREVTGTYSGEPYLARMPASAVELYATAAAETAVLTGWAREAGRPSWVSAGSVSVGSWRRSSRPTPTGGRPPSTPTPHSPSRRRHGSTTCCSTVRSPISSGSPGRCGTRAGRQRRWIGSATCSVPRTPRVSTRRGSTPSAASATR